MENIDWSKFDQGDVDFINFWIQNKHNKVGEKIKEIHNDIFNSKDFILENGLKEHGIKLIKQSDFNTVKDDTINSEFVIYFKHLDKMAIFNDVEHYINVMNHKDINKLDIEADEIIDDEKIKKSNILINTNQKNDVIQIAQYLVEYFQSKFDHQDIIYHIYGFQISQNKYEIAIDNLYFEHNSHMRYFIKLFCDWIINEKGDSQRGTLLSHEYKDSKIIGYQEISLPFSKYKNIFIMPVNKKLDFSDKRDEEIQRKNKDGNLSGDDKNKIIKKYGEIEKRMKNDLYLELKILTSKYHINNGNGKYIQYYFERENSKLIHYDNCSEKEEKVEIDIPMVKDIYEQFIAHIKKDKPKWYIEFNKMPKKNIYNEFINFGGNDAEHIFWKKIGKGKFGKEHNRTNENGSRTKCIILKKIMDI